MNFQLCILLLMQPPDLVKKQPLVRPEQHLMLCHDTSIPVLTLVTKEPYKERIYSNNTLLILIFVPPPNQNSPLFTIYLILPLKQSCPSVLNI